MKVFSDPGSVAVVGASADPAKWGHWLALGALKGRHRRRVHLVNRDRVEIAGQRCVASLRELAEPPELVVLCTPPASLPAVVDEALDLGVQGFLCITAGLADEAALAARIRAAGARLVGPNCLGVYDSATDLTLAWGHFTPGSLGIVSQSGQLGLELTGLAGEAGLGVSRFVSVGNQVDVSVAETLADLGTHPTTAAVVLYAESFRDGRELVATMQRLRAAGKPVVVLSVGATEASRAAARSHTGALTVAADVLDAACRAAGAMRVDTPAQAIDLAQLLLDGARPVGRRLGVVADSGGQGAIAADVLGRHGLTVPALSGPTAAALAALLPAGAGVRNPVDLAGAGERDIVNYARVIELLLGSGEVDGLLLTGYFGSYGAHTPTLVETELSVVSRLSDTVRATGLPLVVHSMAQDSVAVRAMRAHDVPAYHVIDSAARSFGLATALTLNGGRPVRLPAQRPHPALRDTGYLGARELLASYGVRYPAAAPVPGRTEVLRAARSLSAPYVLKAAWLAHKTEAGGVVTGLDDAEAAAEALDRLVGRLGEGPYVLEEMDCRAHAVELIVGARRDPSFGPLVLVGLGGTLTELYRDVAVELAPVSTAEATAMLERLVGYPLLTGWRGRPPVHLAAVAEVVSAVSRLIAERPDVVECEVNPLRAAPDGVLAVDALLVVAGVHAAEFADRQLMTGSSR